MSDDSRAGDADDASEQNTIEQRLTKLRSTNPKRRLYVADSPAGLLIFGVPKLSDYELYLTLALSDEAADKVTARKTLVKACAVDPTPVELDALFSEYPALAGNAEVQSACAKATGIIKDDTAKK